MNPYSKKLKQHMAENPPDFGDGNSILTMHYEAYNEANPMDDDQIKEDFHSLYETMNGMELQEMDKIIYPVCTLCRKHEKAGPVEGVMRGMPYQQGYLTKMTDVFCRLRKRY